jgi:endo-1,4-beta-xylanase
VLDRAATTRGWHRYEHRARIRPGRHALRVALANPFQRAPGCKRSASIDYVDLRERIPIGAAADWALSQDNATYRDTLLANFDSITPENAMKFAFLEPAPGQYDFSGADGLVALAENAGLAFHGHALVFDRQLPLWVQARLSWAPGEVHEMLRSYIDTVVGRYRGRIASWDVVNEPLAPDGSLSPTFFDRQLGPDYIAEALRLAHAADPAAKLYINEVGAEELNPKSDALYALVQRLLAQGVPLDGIGFQFHANIGAGAPRPDAIRANLQRFADLGLEIAMSEVDVRTSTGVGALVARLTQQADVYGEIAQACAAQPACVRFTTWGVLDPFSWLGPNELGLAFDDAGRPKPAWAAITSALR